MDPAGNDSRACRRDLPPSDLLIAGALSVWAILEAFFVSGSGSPAMRILAGCALTVPLVFRRIHPFPVVLFVCAALVVRAAIGSPDEDAASFFPAILLATVSAALYEPRVPRWRSRRVPTRPRA